MKEKTNVKGKKERRQEERKNDKISGLDKDA